MTITSTSTSSYRKEIRQEWGWLIFGVTGVVATLFFFALERSAGERWLIGFILILALWQKATYKQPLLLIGCYTLTLLYTALYIINSGWLPFWLVIPLIAGLSPLSLTANALTLDRTSYYLFSLLTLLGMLTCLYLPTNLICQATVAALPFMLLLPVVLTEKRLHSGQYFGFGLILLAAAIIITSTATFFS